MLCGNQHRFVWGDMLDLRINEMGLLEVQDTKVSRRLGFWTGLIIKEIDRRPWKEQLDALKAWNGSTVVTFKKASRNNAKPTFAGEEFRKRHHVVQPLMQQVRTCYTITQVLICIRS
jgi:hypothetical protein